MTYGLDQPKKTYLTWFTITNKGALYRIKMAGMFKYVSLPATGPIAFIILQPRWPPSFTIYTLTKNGAQIWGLWKEVVRRGFCLENAKNCQFNQCYWSKVYFVTYRWISQAKKKIFKEVIITPKKKVQKEMKRRFSKLDSHWYLHCIFYTNINYFKTVLIFNLRGSHQALFYK